MRRRNALIIGGALAGLGYSLGKRSGVPAYIPEFRTRLVPPQAAEPVRDEKPVETTPRARPDTTELPRARPARAPRTGAARARPVRPKKAKVPVESP
jgi:hypothetical protein